MKLRCVPGARLFQEEIYFKRQYELTKVTAITPNGIVLVGLGEYKVQMENGESEIQTRAWRAVIPKGNLF